MSISRISTFFTDSKIIISTVVGVIAGVIVSVSTINQIINDARTDILVESHKLDTEMFYTRLKFDLKKQSEKFKKDQNDIKEADLQFLSIACLGEFGVSWLPQQADGPIYSTVCDKIIALNKQALSFN